MKTGEVKLQLHWRGYIKFYAHFLHFSYFLVPIWHRIFPYVSTDFELVKNLYTESFMLLGGVNEFIRIYSTHIVRFWWNSVLSDLHIVLLGICELHENKHSFLFLRVWKVSMTRVLWNITTFFKTYSAFGNFYFITRQCSSCQILFDINHSSETRF